MDAARAMPTSAELLRGGAARLEAAGIATARLDAEVLLALAMQIDRAALYARLPAPVGQDIDQRFTALIDRRVRREPIAYITGVQEFWSLPFAVSPSVLIPRPETELVVEIACRAGRQAYGGAEVRRFGGRAQLDANLRTSGPPHLRTPSTDHSADTVTPLICDVGAGSGCIAVAIATELPAARVVALDVSRDALAVAARNAATHGVGDRVTCIESDLFEALPADTRFDMIVSNPPYCRPGDPVSPELAFEPRGALFAGADGLQVIRRLIAGAPGRLRSGGWLVMELGIGLDEAVRADSKEAGLTDISVEPDLAGIPRVLVARRS